VKGKEKIRENQKGEFVRKQHSDSAHHQMVNCRRKEGNKFLTKIIKWKERVWRKNIGFYYGIFWRVTFYQMQILFLVSLEEKGEWFGLFSGGRGGCTQDYYEFLYILLFGKLSKIAKPGINFQFVKSYVY
jgi:hypothetical protein